MIVDGLAHTFSGFVVVGLLVVAGAVAYGVRAGRFRRRAARVTGVVVERHRGSEEHRLVLAFTTLDGQPVRTEVVGGGHRYLAHPGTRLTVLYDPLDPHHATLDGDPTGYLVVAVGAMGVGAVVVGVVGALISSTVPLP